MSVNFYCQHPQHGPPTDFSPRPFSNSISFGLLAGSALSSICNSEWRQYSTRTGDTRLVHLQRVALAVLRRQLKIVAWWMSLILHCQLLLTHVLPWRHILDNVAERARFPARSEMALSIFAFTCIWHLQRDVTARCSGHTSVAGCALASVEET